MTTETIERNAGFISVVLIGVEAVGFKEPPKEGAIRHDRRAEREKGEVTAMTINNNVKYRMGNELNAEWGGCFCISAVQNAKITVQYGPLKCKRGNAKMTTLGNVELLKRDKVAFLSSRRVPPDAVMATLDWAAKVHEEGLCVIGGFQSALERDVLKLLLKEGGGPVVMVLARKMWNTVPIALHEAINVGRLLVVSPVAQNVNRVSEASALARNRFILGHCTSAMFASLNPGGSLDSLLGDFPNLPCGVIADVRKWERGLM